jgi:hypothetical protein
LLRPAPRCQEALHELRHAAWETYIVFQFLYDNLFEILHEEYEHAVHQLSCRRPSGVILQVYRPAGRPQYETATPDLNT